MIQPDIIQTERGLTIAGIRITLYDVMDYVTAQSDHFREFFRNHKSHIEVRVGGQWDLNQSPVISYPL